MEIIFTRYLLALGINRSSAGHVHQVRNSIAAKNIEGAKEALRSLMERYKFASIRLMKMKAAS